MQCAHGAFPSSILSILCPLCPPDGRLLSLRVEKNSPLLVETLCRTQSLDSAELEQCPVPLFSVSPPVPLFSSSRPLLRCLLPSPPFIQLLQRARAAHASGAGDSDNDDDLDWPHSYPHIHPHPHTPTAWRSRRLKARGFGSPAPHTHTHIRKEGKSYGSTGGQRASISMAGLCTCTLHLYTLALSAPMPGPTHSPHTLSTHALTLTRPSTYGHLPRSGLGHSWAVPVRNIIEASRLPARLSVGLSACLSNNPSPGD